MQTEVWAHRGSSLTFIENTLAAFDRAVKDGAGGIELDVQRTKDGKLVVFHDEKLKRLTGVQKFLWELSWEEVQSLTLSSNNKRLNYENSSNTKIPSLEEVLFFLKDTNLMINIELKNSINLYPGMEKEVADCVEKLEMQERVLYSSFNHASMKTMSNLVGSKHCGYLTSDIQYQPWAYAQKIGVEAYHPMINSLQQADLIKTCQENNLKVHVWTADEEAYIYAGLLLGVDALITNKPKKAIQLRKQFAEDGGKKARESVRSLDLSI